MALTILEYINKRGWRTGAAFASVSMLSGFVTMFIGILMIRWIEPGELGIWQSVSILQLYVPFLEMGIPNGLNRELPYLYGKGEAERGIKYAQTAQYFMIVVAIVLFAATLIALIALLALAYDPKIISGVVTVGLMVSINAYQRYLTVTYRSAQSFMSLSKLYVYQTVAQVLLCPLVFYYEYYGLLAYSLLVLFFFTVIMHIHRPVHERPLFNREFFKVLSKTGLPVFAMGYVRGISGTFARIVLLITSGTLFVGLFTPVAAVGTLITMLPGVLANYFFPKMNHLLGESDNPKLLWPLVMKINNLLLLCAVPFIAVMWIATPFFVKEFFEKYTEAIPAMQVFSLNFLFAGTSVSHNAVYSVKAYKAGYIFTALEFVLRFVCPYLLVYTLEGNVLTLTAYGVVFSNALLFVFNLILIRRVLFRTS